MFQLVGAKPDGSLPRGLVFVVFEYIVSLNGLIGGYNESGHVMYSKHSRVIWLLDGLLLLVFELLAHSHLGKPKVCQLGVAFGIEEDVVRLEVSMDNGLASEILQSEKYFCHVVLDVHFIEGLW